MQFKLLLPFIVAVSFAAPTPGGSETSVVDKSYDPHSSNIGAYTDTSANGDGLDDWSTPPDVLNNPLFVPTNSSQGGVVGALKVLDQRMQALGLEHLITTKKPHSIGGSRVNNGEIGYFDNEGKPRITFQPGQYWYVIFFSFQDLASKSSIQGIKAYSRSTRFLGSYYCPMRTVGSIGCRRSSQEIVCHQKRRMWV